MRFLLSITLAGLYLLLTAQTPITIGQEYSIPSSILEEERPVLVYLPDDYDENEEADYPVLYVLDGHGHFHHTTACVQFLSRNRRIPQMIVIGIPNTEDHRTRDLTPPTAQTQNFPAAGGADNMVSFIANELMPWVKDHYRTADYQTIIGHSFGGLFVIHAMINHPDVFNSYLAISPSLWWDDQKLATEQTDAFFDNPHEQSGHLYMTMGDEGGTMVGGGWKLAARLEEQANPNFKWHYEVMEEENHGTVPYRSTRQGLEFIFADWNWDKRRRTVRELGIAGLQGYEEEVQTLYGLPVPWDEPDLMRAAQQHYDQGDYITATPVYAKITEIFPESDRAWHLYGECLSLTGQKESAITAIEQALQLDPDNQAAAVALQKLRAGEDGIQLSAAELEVYVGSYDLSAVGMVIHLSSTGEKLQVHTDQSTHEDLYPLGNHQFFLTTREAKLTFTISDGKATRVDVETPEGNFGGEKQ